MVSELGVVSDTIRSKKERQAQMLDPVEVGSFELLDLERRQEWYHCMKIFPPFFPPVFFFSLVGGAFAHTA